MGGELVDLAEENTFFLTSRRKKERKNQQVGVVSIYVTFVVSPRPLPLFLSNQWTS
jgi:hypothetical protein